MVRKLFFAMLLLPSVALAQPGGNPLPNKAATEATLGTRLSETDFDLKTGSLTEVAPATDTASSGINGRMQRLAQRITSLIALLPTSLTGAGNLRVSLEGSNTPQSVTQGTTPWVTAGTATVSGTIAATQSGTWTVQPGNTANTTAWKVDGSAVTQPISGTVTATQGTSPWVVSGSINIPTAAAVATESVISVNDASTSVLALNASRKGGWVRNISASNIFVSFSATATTAKPTLLEPGDALSLGLSSAVIYTGAVSAIHAVVGQTRSLEVVEF